MKKSLLLLALIVLAGCTTMADAKREKGSGIKQAFSASFDDTWKATICSINSSDLDLVSEDRANETILAQRGITFFSHGENVAIFLHKISEKETQVEVASVKALKTNILAPEWSSSIFKGIGTCLKK